MQSIITDVVTSISFGKGLVEALRFLNSLQLVFMENLYIEDFSVELENFLYPKRDGTKL